MNRVALATGAAIQLATGLACAQPLPLEDAARFASPGISYRGGATLNFPGVGFGGLSALAVLDEGARALALSDAGVWFELKLDTAANGDIAGATLLRHGKLVDPSGKPPATKRLGDSEALALQPDGGLIVAYEQQHRLHRYPRSDPPFGHPPQRIAAPASLSRAKPNGGIEALAALAGGQLLALTESLAAAPELVAGDPGEWGAGFLYDGQRWTALAYALSDGFVPSDAALMPDGDVLVLERAWRVLGGFESRLVRLSASTLKPAARLRGQAIARFSTGGVGDNFEGLAVRQDGSGRTFVYLVSDDNFSPWLRSVLVMLELRN